MRRALYLLGTYGATLPWLIGLACMYAAYWMAVWSGRLYPDAEGPNCWVYGARRYAQHRADWKRGGGADADQPYAVLRESRKWPPWVLHLLVADHRDAETGAMPLESYKPTDPQDVPWWRVWTRVRFRGRRVDGD